MGDKSDTRHPHSFETSGFARLPRAEPGECAVSASLVKQPIKQPSVIARIVCEAPGRPVSHSFAPLVKNRGCAGRQGSEKTHGPRRLATSRLVEVLVSAASPPNPGRPARDVYRFAPRRPRLVDRRHVVAARDSPPLRPRHSAQVPLTEA